MVLQESKHCETLAVATKRSRVGMLSTAIKNEIDEGRKKDVSNVTFDPNLPSWFKFHEETI